MNKLNIARALARRKLLFVYTLNIAFRKFNYEHVYCWRKCVDLLAENVLMPCIRFGRHVMPALKVIRVGLIFNLLTKSPVIPAQAGIYAMLKKLGSCLRRNERVFIKQSTLFVLIISLVGCASNEQLFARYDALCHQGVCVAARPTEVFYTPEVSLVWEPAVYFGYDLDELQASEIARLDSNLEFLNRYAGLKISLQGFADNSASKKYNLQLSDRRIRHVRDYLLAEGVAEDRILASRGGESLPIKSGNSIEDQIINRRVEMMLLDASGRPLSVGVNPDVADPNNFVAPEPNRKIKE